MLVRAQIVLGRDSGLAEDQIVNNLFFNVPDGTLQAGLDEVIADVRGFYNTFAAPDTRPLSSLLGPSIDPATSRIKLYDMAGPPPHFPIRDVPLNNGAPSGFAELPAEVSVVLSFQAAKQAGFDQKNRRGRIYFGTVSTESVISTVAGSRPNDLTRNLLARQAARLRAFNTALKEWVVVSQYDGTDAAGKPIKRPAPTFALVTDGWVDDAWDTQRRRGIAPTSRIIWPAPV